MYQLKFREATKYPEVYENCYWGNFRNRNNQIDEEIVKNRNDFVETFRIKCPKTVPNNVCVQSEIYTKPGVLDGKFGDHAEFYKIKDGYIVIVSPYAPVIIDGVRDFTLYDEEAIEKGYTKIPQMYTKATETYMKVIYDNKKK